MADLVNAYCANAPELAPFFAGRPEALLENPPSAAPLDPALVQALRDYNGRLGKAMALDGYEYTVVTGQQAGLFTGPLYTIYKAITAIRLAREMTDQWGGPCLPIFWLASDDHDFEEIQSACFLTKRHEPMTLTYVPETAVPGSPAYRIPIEDSLHFLIDTAADTCRGSDDHDGVPEFLHVSLDASASLADWTARLLARLFRDTPLVLFAPHMPVARALAAPVFARELEDPLAATQEINGAGGRLRSLGFEQQVVKEAGACAFYLELGGRRRRVAYADGRFTLPEEGIVCEPEEMGAFLEGTPERFSANVALRTVVQQALFHPSAYVAGPGELTYWAQFKGLFERHGLPMPVVYPRARAVLTSMKLEKIREKLALGLDELDAPREKLTAAALARAVQGPARLGLRERRSAIDRAFAETAAMLHEHDTNAAAMIQSVAARAAEGLDKVDAHLAHKDETRRATVEKQVARVTHALMPFRKPQERVYNIFSFLFEQGWGLVPRLLEELDCTPMHMNIVEL